MGAVDTRNMYSDFAVNKYLHTVVSGWIFINIFLSVSLAGQNYLHYDCDIKHLLKIDIFIILGVTYRCDINIPRVRGVPSVRKIFVYPLR